MSQLQLAKPRANATPKRPDYDDYMLEHPGREPDWRHRRARDLLQNGEALEPKTDGPITRLYAEQLMRVKAGLPLITNRYSQRIRVAVSWQRNIATRTRLRARILAGHTAAEIGEIESVDPQNVMCFAGLYFNVTDRLKHWDYIFSRVIRFGDRSREYLLSTGFLFSLASYELGKDALNLLLHPVASDGEESQYSELLEMRQRLLVLTLRIRIGAARPDEIRNKQWLREFRRLEKRYRKLERVEQQAALVLAQLKTPLLKVETMTNLVDHYERQVA